MSFELVPTSDLKDPLDKTPIGDVEWLDSITDWGTDKICRLARLGIIKGAFKAQPGTEFNFQTRFREVWRGELSELQFIVPNPMIEPVGLTKSGKWSEHAQSSTGRRVYLVIEFDFSQFERDGVTPTIWAPLIEEWKSAGITIADACSALHLHLAEELPLVMVVWSGGRSVHGWYYVFDRTSDEGIWPFMRQAYSIGADHVTWNRAQFVRMPEGRRANGNRRSLIYLNPGKAVKDA